MNLETAGEQGATPTHHRLIVAVVREESARPLSTGALSLAVT
jgi:hypothetical protein